MLYAGLSVIGVLVALIAMNRRNVSAGMNMPIQYDDFAFSVLDSRQVPDAPGVGPGLIELVVTLKINNRARRVSFSFQDDWAVLCDKDGVEYHVSQRLQRAFEAEHGRGNPTARPLPAGTAVTKELVFEVPAALRSPRLKIKMGGPVGEVLETVLFGRKTFQLP
jgi:hypothetical protein